MPKVYIVEAEREKLKSQVRAYGRKKLSEKLGCEYQNLGLWLGGFRKIEADVLAKMRRILRAHLKSISN